MEIGYFNNLFSTKLPKSIILWFLLFITLTTTAQQFINPHFNRFTINSGLSQSLIYSITQDHTGFMWFGTKDGLNRYDSYEFKSYHHDPFDSASIADNAISTLFTDSKGRLWVGTMNGSLDLFNNKKNNFIHFLKNNINKGSINAITEDHSGNIWVGTYGNGIFKLIFKNSTQPDQDVTVLHFVNKPGDTTTLNNNFIIDVFADKSGGLWISTTSTLFQYAMPGPTELRFSNPAFPIEAVGKKQIPQGIQFDITHTRSVPADKFRFGGARFVEDHEHRIWMGTLGGTFLFDQKNNKLLFFDPIALPELTSGNIRSICNVSYQREGKNINAILLGFLSGAGILDTKNFTLQIFSNDPANSRSLLSGSTLSVFQDRLGGLWLGSSGSGLSELDIRSTLFPIPEFHTADGKIRTENLSVRSFFDTPRYLFIGTQDVLMIADKTTGLMKNAVSSGYPANFSLVFNIAAADSASCWFATNSGLVRYNYKNHTNQIYLTGIQRGNQVDNRIFKLLKDKHGNLWCLTPYSLSQFNPAQKNFTHYFFNHGSVNGYTEPTYGDLYEDPKGNFWAGTGDGLLYFDRATQTFQRYNTNSSDPQSLSFDAVRSIVPDPNHPEKYLWIATAGGGLNKFDLSTRKFTHFTEAKGLPNNVIYGILADNHGNLWLSTNRGISMFDPASEIFYNYDVTSGLQSNEFNSGAFYKNKEGRLFFGGINGFNAFFPAEIKKTYNTPQLAITGFSIFNHPVSIHDKNSPLQDAISETKKIVLPYRDNIISFQVAALDYSDPAQKQYAYMLEPSNKNWIQMGNNRLITFSNLDPGNYTLRIKTGYTNGSWNEKGISLNLIILPPWWRTWWAYLLYSLVAAAMLLLIRKFELRRVELRNRLRVEHLEAQKLKELSHLKSRFFANISHEFRTPLTLIMGPVEDLLKTGNEEHFKKILPEVHRNSKRLLQLINQLLDLSKLDAKSYHINTTREDIIPFTKQIVRSFSSMAEKRNIDLAFEVDPKLTDLLEEGKTRFYFDEDMIEKIVNNLLSNAFKFTGDSGSIHVRMNLSEMKNNLLELSVSDTGTGIPAEKLPHVFDRFYQADDTDERRYEGSGVGLSLLKELVDLLHGQVRVESVPGAGTTFFCYLPFDQKIFSGKAISGIENMQKPVIDSPTEEPLVVTPFPNDELKDHVLIIEDHQDVRKYIRGKLEDTYSVSEASNGKEGLEIARNMIPDLVISDVMMPEMDGFELCRKLKTGNLTSHIPIILLTARAEDHDKISGLETGADAYLVKPFNSQELDVRVKNLIELRKKLRAKFSNKLVVKPSEITVTSMDQEFMKKLMTSVEAHLSDAKFSVSQLGEEVNMSVSQLNRKLKAIIDQSPQKFIRSLRMQRALELLRKDKGNVSEISWEVGFEDPGYFSKVFKNHFGCLPSEKDKLPQTYGEI